jgi:HAD superfamily hydrolase (TIGR01509 family)
MLAGFKRPQAVVFDMDGTLIDSEPIWRMAEVSVFNAIGVPLTEEECSQTVGVRIDKVVEYWFQRRPWQGVSLPEVETRIVNEVAQIFREKGEAKPDAIRCIQELNALGIPLAVASASPARLIQSNIESLGVVDAFKVIHSAEDEVAGKPHPAVYLSTVRKLGVDPKDCVAFEDSLHGIDAARAAGLFCIAIKEDATSFTEASRRADSAVESFSEFLDGDLFQAWSSQRFD